MILGGDKDPAVLVPHRLVCSPVAELKFVGIATESKCRDLVAHADPENGKISQKILYAADHVRCLLGVSRAITHKEGIRPAGPYLIRCDVVWENVQIPVPF